MPDFNIELFLFGCIIVLIVMILTKMRYVMSVVKDRRKKTTTTSRSSSYGSSSHSSLSRSSSSRSSISRSPSDASSYKKRISYVGYLCWTNVDGLMVVKKEPVSSKSNEWKSQDRLFAMCNKMKFGRKVRITMDEL